MHTQTIACIVVPSFPLACELVERPHLRGLPVALGGGDGGLRVLAPSEEALRFGVRVGATLREALGLCPSLVVLEPRPTRYEVIWDDLIAALQLVSPIVQRERPGVAFIDLTGLDRLYGERLPAMLLDCAPIALEPRLGIASGKFPAFVAASAAGPGNAITIAVDEVTAFLAPQPIDLLPLDAETLRRMRLLGVGTLGVLATLPRQAVQAQFGRAGTTAWDLARGVDGRSIMPEPYVERIIEALDFGPPLVSREAVLMALQTLLTRSLRQPRVQQRFVRAVAVSAVTERDRRWHRLLTLKEPTGDRDRLWLALRTIIDYADLPGAIATLRLELSGLTSEGGKQVQLFRERARRQEELEEMLRQLKARYGHCPVGRVVEVEPWSRVPERRMALVDFDP